MPEDLTYVCSEKHETRMETGFTFRRTQWFIGSGEGEDVKFETVHWSTEGAEPDDDNGYDIVITADSDEYEVGRHYAFIVNGPLAPAEKQPATSEDHERAWAAHIARCRECGDPVNFPGRSLCDTCIALNEEE